MRNLYNYALLAAGIFVIIQSCSKAVIDEGNQGGTTPITKTIKYDPDVKTVMNDFCVSCHSGVSPAAGLDLQTFANVKNSAQNGKLIDRMNNAANPMPPSGLAPAAQRQIIDKWKADGFLEN